MAEGKWISGLAPDTPVPDAARAVLATRFEVVRHYLPLATEKPEEDIEYVHQLRVSTRRARAALRLFADYLPKKHLKAAKNSLRAIRQAAGAARDWDVFVQSLPNTRSLTSVAGKPALDFLLGYGLGERNAAQARLVEATNEMGATFVEQSQSLPDRVRDAQKDSPPGSFGELAYVDLNELLADFTAGVRANVQSPVDLHQLRIRGKRFRYAMEIFSECFSPALRETIYTAVEDLQELLGTSQDATVGVERLEKLRERVRAAIPQEWSRLNQGINGLIRSLKTKIRMIAQKEYLEWARGWEALIVEHPLESLRLSPQGVSNGQSSG